MVNTELHWVQLFIRYICLVTMLMLDKLQHTPGYCHAVRCGLHLVQYNTEVFDRSIKMLSITVVSRTYEFRLSIGLGAQGGSQISTGQEDFAGSRAVLLMLSKDMEIELADFKEENPILKGECLQQAVEIGFEGIPIVLEVRLLRLFIFLGGIQLKGFISTNLYDLLRHQLGLRTVEVGIQLFTNIYFVADIILPGVHLAPFLGQPPSFNICFYIYR
jgi:hypothetical protein